MNDDVLGTVALYCDMDTRRSMGCVPGRLKRCADFDRALGKILCDVKSRCCHYRTSDDGPFYDVWEFVLNQRIRVYLCPCGVEDGTTKFRVRHTFRQLSECVDEYIVEQAPDNVWQTFSNVHLDQPLLWVGADVVLVVARYMDGCWVVHHSLAEHLSAQSRVALKQLGYIVP